MSSVLITGANRGLGLEFAAEYAADGWHVFAACRSHAKAERLKELAQKPGSRVSILAMDVTDRESIRNAAIQLKDAAIDVLINNAGIGGPRGQTTGNVDYAAWAHVFDVNTMGPLRVLEAFIHQLARSERKLAVTITSGMGFDCRQYFGRLYSLPQLQGGGEHGHAKRCHRSCPTSNHVRPSQSRVGENRHGRPRR